MKNIQYHNNELGQKKPAELVAYCHFIATYCPLPLREGI